MAHCPPAIDYQSGQTAKLGNKEANLCRTQVARCRLSAAVL